MTDPRIRSLMDDDELRSVQLQHGGLLDLLGELNFGSEVEDEAMRRSLAQAFLAGRNSALAERAGPTTVAREKPRSPFKAGLAPKR